MENFRSNENTEIFFIKKFFNRMINYWYVFVISVFITVLCALFINWTSEPVYEAGTTILVNEDKGNNSVPDPSQAMFQSFSFFATGRNLQNQMLFFKSSQLIYNALKINEFEVSYYKKYLLKPTELYKESPFTIDFEPSVPQPLGVKFRIIPIDEKSFRIKCEKKGEINLYNYEEDKVAGIIDEVNLDLIYNYGETIKGDNYNFKVLLNVETLYHFDDKSNYYFHFNDIKSLVYFYQKTLKVTAVNEEVDAASIAVRMTNDRKGIDFINSLTEAYLQRNLDKKNFTAENTIMYIDNQLSDIEDSLTYTERNLENFRSSHQVLDISSKADRIYDMIQLLEDQKNQLQTKADYYKYIDDYLDKNKEVFDLPVPSSMGVDDPVLSNIMQDLISLNTEKNNLLKNNQDKSPYFSSLSNRIEILKKTLAENVKYLINTHAISLTSINNKLQNLNREINRLPGTERQLVGIERKFKINDNIYTFLLQKRAEAQIVKASNLPDTEIIEPSRLNSIEPISPKKQLNLFLGFLLGIILPNMFFWFRETMDESVTDESMLRSISNLPLLGGVAHKSSRNSMAILVDKPNSMVAESFRSIRTNLDFYLKGEQNKVILVTSTVSGEGKSFSALNIAIGLSLFNHKTILIDFDLRKPKLHEYIGVENILGTSSYFINKANFDDIMTSTRFDNLDFISAGPIPPNPVELMRSGKTDQLFTELKSKYDYIIIDCSPVGLVTDTFQLFKYSDLNVYVVRQKYTPKKHMISILKDIEEKKIPDLCLLLNDVAINGSYYQKKYKYYSKKSKK
ncbi:MAG: polysaccharide biosynthesis tyrosine autokinase [Bacteroidales bacterium]|nr:polysaccharide biosynthesis tyrosine autokinase [Bacteroidales bacterium]